jgi:hypothetical protein
MASLKLQVMPDNVSPLTAIVDHAACASSGRNAARRCTARSPRYAPHRQDPDRRRAEGCGTWHQTAGIGTKLTSSSAQSLTTMDKTGRNDPCPCGSGKKYKKCCLPKHEADQRQQFAEQQAERDQRAAAHRLSLREVRAAIAARLAGIEQAEDDPLTAASNAVVELIHAGKLDEAEHAARDLLVRFPDVHDGYDRLGMVHEARGENQQAADCYRKVIAFIRQHPDDYDDAFEDAFVKLVAKLDPPPAA